MTESKLDWCRVARIMILSRALDRLEVEDLTPRGLVKYQFSAGGHELGQVLLAQALDHPHDAAGVYYRSRPFMLASGLTAVEALAAGMARTGSPNQGLDVGVVFNLPRRSGATVLPSSGNVGAQYTPVAGWAHAIHYRQNVLEDDSWRGAIAVALGGDGSVATNGFWAALNIVTPQKLPYLFFIEDNGYGLSVPASLQTPGGDIAANLASYTNLQIFQADGSYPLETWEAIQAAVDTVRGGDGPCLLRLRVPRLAGHTFIDNQAYKPPELIAEETARDPLRHLKHYLIESKILDDQVWDNMEREAARELDSALERAFALPEPDLEMALSHRFFQGVAPSQGGLRSENTLLKTRKAAPAPSGARVNFIDAVRRTLEVEMDLNPRIAVFGEDVGKKGGVHGATQGLAARFGEHRVFDTSLSEEGIIGRAVGMALAGLLPAPEIQFRKYADPAHEQISDLGTLRWRTANRFAAPLVVRIPVGYSKKTGDPWHSVTGEAIFAHLVGWQIAFPSNAEDATGLLRTALRGDDPVFFFEHRALLDTPEGRRPYPGDEYCLPFGAAVQLVEGDELSVVTWGAMVPRCVEAAQAFRGRVTVLDLRTIIPWDKETVLESVRRTGKALVVHEDTLTGGFAGEIIAAIASDAFYDLDAPVERLASPDIPIPYNVSLMNALLPNVDSIRKKMGELLAF